MVQPARHRVEANTSAPGPPRNAFLPPGHALQVAHYPPQLLDPGPDNLRKKAHVDSGTLTLLASDDWEAGSCREAGQGGLQLLNAQGQWVQVDVPPGTLLLNIGSLMSRWTNGVWRSTLHRVVNPRHGPHAGGATAAACSNSSATPQASSSSSSADSASASAGSSHGALRAPQQRSRLSIAYFAKPNYDALIEVLPTCCSNPAAAQLLGSGAAAAARFAPCTAAELTRAGILHKYAHLPQREASAKYHAMLSEMSGL